MFRAPLLAACLLAGCTSFQGDDRVVVTSDPPGATILVDGTDLGYTTPKALDIGGLGGSDHVITLHKKGFRSETRLLLQMGSSYTARFVDGAPDFAPPVWPLAWTFGDFFIPLGVRWAFGPGELHVKLYREDEPLLGFDVLRGRAEPASPRPAAPPESR